MIPSNLLSMDETLLGYSPSGYSQPSFNARGVWYLELTGTFNQAIAKFGEAVWSALALMTDEAMARAVHADHIEAGRLCETLEAASAANPDRKELREFVALLKELPENQHVTAADIRAMLEHKLTEDMRKARDVAHRMDAHASLRPPWAAGALVFLTPEDLPMIRPRIEQLAMTWQPPRRGINRVFVSEEYKPWVHSVISKKRHVERRGHQEGKHKCIVDEKLTHLAWPYPLHAPEFAQFPALAELLLAHAPIAPPPSMPLEPLGSVVENAFALSQDFNAVMGQGFNTPDFSALLAGDFAPAVSAGPAVAPESDNRPPVPMPRFETKKPAQEIQKVVPRTPPPSIPVPKRPDMDQFCQYLWIMSGRKGMATEYPGVDPTNGMWCVGGEEVVPGVAVTWGIHLTHRARVGVLRKHDYSWMCKKVLDNEQPRGLPMMETGYYTPQTQPYNVLDGLRYGWAQDGDWARNSPQGPYDEGGFTGSGFDLEPGTYTMKVDLKADPTKKNKWRWWGKLTVSRDNSVVQQRAWIRMPTMHNDAFRIAVVLPPMANAEESAFITRTERCA
jgi:hypothetical protein